MAVGDQFEARRLALAEVLLGGQEDAIAEAGDDVRHPVLVLPVVERGEIEGLSGLVLVAGFEGVGDLRLQVGVAGAEVERVDLDEEGIEVLRVGPLHAL